jgi:hypothetical protein
MFGQTSTTIITQSPKKNSLFAPIFFLEKRVYLPPLSLDPTTLVKSKDKGGK